MSARRAWEWIGVIVMTTGVGRPGALRAQSSADPVRLVRTTDAVALDGRPRETAWNAAPPVPLVQYTPTEGAGTSDSSDIRLLYDDKFLYVGARLFVEDPGSIRPGLFARDQLGTEDHLMVILDSAGDERTGLVFALNPAGGLTDNAIGGDGQNVDKSWNGYWDGATSRDESAWYAEFRIPISTLRFQPGRDGAVMGVIIHVRRRRGTRWPPTRGCPVPTRTVSSVRRSRTRCTWPVSRPVPQCTSRRICSVGQIRQPPLIPTPRLGAQHLRPEGGRRRRQTRPHQQRHPRPHGQHGFRSGRG